jgi:hypothetical protein
MTTTDHAFTWNDIYQAIGRGAGASADFAHVATETLVRYQPEWIGLPTWGQDLLASVRQFQSESCRRRLYLRDNVDRMVAASCAACLQRHGHAQLTAARLDPFFDRIIAEQRAIGTPTAPL